MIENNYFTENEDIMLQFNDIIDWQEIIQSYEGDFLDSKKYKETGDEALAMAPSNAQEAMEYYQSVLESLGDIAGTKIAQAAAAMDAEKLKFNDGKVTFPKAMLELMDTVKEAGVLPYSISRKYGGLGIPATVQTMAMDIVCRADAAFGIAMGTMNLAETVERFASEEMIQEYVPQMARGELCGAMALTEPNYGSDLPNVQTKAVKDENGQWKLTGTKRFITHGCGFGDIPAIILTLARTGSPTSGARGLSFFLVHSKDVEIASIEKKIGLHCSPTCEVVYDNSPGLLIGHEGFGLVKYSMGMMNTARMSIAAQAMGVATAAWAEARKYAGEREQFGKFIQDIPAVKKMLDSMDREIAAMRCMLFESARAIDNYHWRSERMKEEGVNEKEITRDPEIRRWQKLADLFTPMSKYYITEHANKIAYDALQIHGGSGYTQDYDVSRIFKDVRITNIYEGTTQLQIVAAIGGVVAGLKETGHLRQFIDSETEKFAVSSEWKELKKSLEEIYSSYVEIKDGDLKDELAFEMVESAARVLIGMLMEKSTSRIKDSGMKEKREKLCKDYNMESFSILAGNKATIQNRNKAQELVGA